MRRSSFSIECVCVIIFFPFHFQRIDTVLSMNQTTNKWMFKHCSPNDISCCWYTQKRTTKGKKKRDREVEREIWYFCCSIQPLRSIRISGCSCTIYIPYIFFRYYPILVCMWCSFCGCVAIVWILYTFADWNNGGVCNLQALFNDIMCNEYEIILWKWIFVSLSHLSSLFCPHYYFKHLGNHKQNVLSSFYIWYISGCVCQWNPHKNVFRSVWEFVRISISTSTYKFHFIKFCNVYSN